MIADMQQELKSTKMFQAVISLEKASKSPSDLFSLFQQEKEQI